MHFVVVNCQVMALRAHCSYLILTRCIGQGPLISNFMMLLMVMMLDIIEVKLRGGVPARRTLLLLVLLHNLLLVFYRLFVSFI